MLDRIKGWLAWIGGILLVVLTLGLAGRRKRPMADEVDDALSDTRDAARHARDVAEEERAAREERLRKAKELADRLRRLPVVLLLAACLVLAVPAVAQEPSLPGDYEQLADLYLQTVEIARQYRDLYQAAEASNARLLAELDALRQQVEQLTATVERQQKLIEKQQQSILGLLGGLELRAGVDATSFSPITLTPWVAVSYRF